LNNQYDPTNSDVVNPKFDWIDTNGNNVRFNGSGGDNVYSSSDLPSFTFTKSSDVTAGISRYEILVKPAGKDYYPYITDIPDKASGTTLDTTERYTGYSGNEITVYSKRSADKLTGGAYKWMVRAIDSNGNSIDSDQKILRINTLSANFSGEWFFLVLLSKTSSETPSFSGISTVGSKVTVKLIQNGVTVASKEALVDQTSRFKVNFTDKLPEGLYTVNISAVNKNNDYIELSEFTLKISKYIALPSPNITSVLSESGSNLTTTPKQVSAPSPTPASKPKHCFLWWCW
jgi:hypothetical protein